jgi:hypothetical protein
MDIPASLSQTLATAATAVTSPQSRQDAQPPPADEVGPNREREAADNPAPGTQVSFSDEAKRLATAAQTNELDRNSVRQASETVNEPRQSDASRNAEILAGTAKSISEAISAYREASVI